MDNWQQIKQRINIADLCASRGYNVNRAGFIACGGENTPSLKLYPPDKWHCFRCSEGGDCFDLLAHLEGMMSGEAFDYLAGVAGVDTTRRSTVIDADKCDLEALDAALRGNGWNSAYKPSQFRYRELWELFRWVCLGRYLCDTEVMRLGCKEFGPAWDKRLNHKMSAAVDVLLFGVDFYSGDCTISDLRRGPILYGCLDYPHLEVV